MPVNKYTKNPITIRALQFTTNYQELIDFVNNPDVLWVEDGVPYIKTLEGELKVSCFDYVIEGIHGEFYPCKPEIFEASYTEAVKLPEYLPEHMQRVYTELNELITKIRALSKYLVNDYPGASKIEKILLLEQVVQMSNYLSILQRRLGLYAHSKETKFIGIYAHDEANVFGQDGHLPWDPPKEDMKHFREKTLLKIVIMGRKTFESLGSKPLKHRLNIVVSSQYKEPIFKPEEEIIFIGSLDAAFELCRSCWFDEAYVIGGTSILEEALPQLSTVYETIIDGERPVGEGTIRFRLDTDPVNWKTTDLQEFEWGIIQKLDRIK